MAGFAGANQRIAAVETEMIPLLQSRAVEDAGQLGGFAAGDGDLSE